MSDRPSLFTISVVVPVYNESLGLSDFHKSLTAALKQIPAKSYEVIYCDDGSVDTTVVHIKELARHDKRVKLVALSRNFGKENALTAGIAHANGDAVLTLDGDGQHPTDLIPEFVTTWQQGAQVVVGIRTENQGEGWVKRWGSTIFHRMFNSVTGQELLAGSTDFRLIDKEVQQEFLKLHESDRITRGLIDWLGYERQYVYFKANPRQTATPGYGFRKLTKLAINSFVSLSPTPLYLFGYLGVVITGGSLLLGLSILIEQLLLGDPLGWDFTGTAMLSVLMLFLIGIVLMSQGILSLYISHMHTQTKQRPIYVINQKRSINISKDNGK